MTHSRRPTNLQYFHTSRLGGKPQAWKVWSCQIMFLQRKSSWIVSTSVTCIARNVHDGYWLEEVQVQTSDRWKVAAKSLEEEMSERQRCQQGHACAFVSDTQFVEGCHFYVPDILIFGHHISWGRCKTWNASASLLCRRGTISDSWASKPLKRSGTEASCQHVIFERSLSHQSFALIAWKFHVWRKSRTTLSLGSYLWHSIFEDRQTDPPTKRQTNRRTDHAPQPASLSYRPPSLEILVTALHGTNRNPW